MIVLLLLTFMPNDFITSQRCGATPEKEAERVVALAGRENERQRPTRIPNDV